MANVTTYVMRQNNTTKPSYTFSDIFLPISVSLPLHFPLLCLSIVYAYNLSFLILQSHHFILSLLFSKYFFHS